LARFSTVEPPQPDMNALGAAHPSRAATASPRRIELEFFISPVPPAVFGYFTTGTTSGSLIVKHWFGGATQLIASYQNCLVW
jgi:hypothetical protein